MESWERQGQDLILVREIRQSTGLYVFPSKESPYRDVDAAEPSGCLMSANLKETSQAEVREILQVILASAEQAWIAMEDRSVRVK